jgi:hypothetical protein
MSQGGHEIDRLRERSSVPVRLFGGRVMNERIPERAMAGGATRHD